MFTYTEKLDNGKTLFKIVNALDGFLNCSVDVQNCIKEMINIVFTTTNDDELQKALVVINHLLELGSKKDE